jgi:hypothetical protein
MNTSDYGLPLKCSGAVAIGLTDIQNTLVVFLHLQLELITLWFLSIPTDKNVKD